MALNKVKYSMIGNELHEKLDGISKGIEVLNNKLNIVNSDRDTLLSGFSIEGDEIVNLVPLFNSGAWNFHANVTVDSPTKITLNATEGWQLSSIPLSFEAGTTLSLSAKNIHPNAKFRMKLVGGGVQYLPHNGSPITLNSKSASLEIGSDIAGEIIFEEICLVEGTEPKPFVANVQPIRRPYVRRFGKNLIPPFYKWDNVYLPAITKLEDYYVVFNTGREGGDTRTLTTYIPIMPNETYTMSTTFRGRLLVRTLDKDGNIIDNKLNYTALDGTTVERTVRDTFTTEPNADKLIVTFHNQFITNEDAYMKDLQLELGSVATPFEPYKESIQVLDTDLFKGERVEWQDGKAIKTKTKEEVLLGGGLNWTYKRNYSDRKTLFVKNFVDKTTVNTNQNLVKYNGTLLEYNPHMDAKDSFRIELSNGNLELTISNEDSGWGDGYTPTPEEIKAYFMGWRMYDGSSGQTIDGVYNRTDGVNKRWAYRDSNGNLVNSGTGNQVPTYEAPKNGHWQPYRLIYELKDTLKEKVDVIGEVKLDKGKNIVEIGYGLIKDEVAIPQLKSGTDEWYFNEVGYTRLATDTPFNYPLGHLKDLYENGKEVRRSNLTIISFDGHGNYVFYIKDKDYNQKARYTVDYFIMDYLSTPVGNVTIEYPKNIGSTVNELVNKVASHSEDLGYLNSLPIENSVIIEHGENANGKYVKWNNGLMVIWDGISIPANEGVQDYRYDGIMPANFKEVPSLFTSAYNNHHGGSKGGVAEVLSYPKEDSYIATFNFPLSSFADGSFIFVNIFAIGRWR